MSNGFQSNQDRFVKGNAGLMQHLLVLIVSLVEGREGVTHVAGIFARSSPQASFQMPGRLAPARKCPACNWVATGLLDQGLNHRAVMAAS